MSINNNQVSYANIEEGLIVDDHLRRPTATSSSSSSNKTATWIHRLITVGLLIATIVLAVKVASMVVSINNDQTNPCTQYQQNKIDERNSNLKTYFSQISNDSIWKHLSYLSWEVHLAGSQRDYETALYVRDTMKANGIPIVEIEELEVLLSKPINISLVSYTPSTDTFYHAKLREDYYPVDPQSNPKLASDIPFLGYSASTKNGPVNGSLIYANYGREEDFRYLNETLKVKCDKCIFIMRYGHVFRGNKIASAQEYGAIAAILYDDPYNTGYLNGPVFPEGPWTPPSGQADGTIWDGNGDATTPGWPSVPEQHPYRISEEKLYDPQYTYGTPLPAIPAIPMSYEDAQHLLSSLKGQVAPAKWQGGLNFTYHIGDGVSNCYVSMDVKMDQKVEKIWNVIGEIPGEVDRDRIILLGNHRDAWQFGTADPSSGTATLLEVTKGFGALLKQGWKPRRSIVFCSWDAEEYATIGSVEHGEHYEHKYIQRAVAYLNVDISVSGSDYFSMDGQEPLTTIAEKVLNMVPAPPLLVNDKVKTMYDMWLKDDAWSDPKQTPFLDATGLGTGSDFNVFAQHLGIMISSMRMTSYDGHYSAVYHSHYDDLYWMRHFADPLMENHKAVAQVWGGFAIELAQEILLPMNWTNYSKHFVSSMQTVFNYYGPKYNDAALNQSFIWTIEAFNKLQNHAVALDQEVARIRSILKAGASSDGTCAVSDYYVKQLNDRLTHGERGFLYFEGVRGRAWYRNLAWVPSLYDQYGGDVAFALIADAFFNDNFDEVYYQLSLTRTAIYQVIEIIKL